MANGREVSSTCRQDAGRNFGETPLRASVRRHDACAPGGSLTARTHPVCCPYCRRTFDLFAAQWCTHLAGGQPSKRCPQCDRCLCEHPAYEEPHFWTEAPPAFRRRGFDRLFAFYL